LLLALAASGCTLSSDEFEPTLADRIGSESSDVSDLLAPPAEEPAPSGVANAPVEETRSGEGVDSDTPLVTDGRVGPTDQAGNVETDPDPELDPNQGLPDAGAEVVSAPLPSSTDAEATVTPPEPAPSEPEPEPCAGRVFAASCYQFVGELVSWPVAEQRCVDAGGHLASVESFEENAFLDGWPAELGLAAGSGVGIWLGGTDAVVDGNFQWSSNSPMGFTNWAPNQPDNGPDANGVGVDCIEKRSDFTAAWYDRRCTELLPYVCETPL
jgi:C-type mannose receptor